MSTTYNQSANGYSGGGGGGGPGYTENPQHNEQIEQGRDDEERDDLGRTEEGKNGEKKETPYFYNRRTKQSFRIFFFVFLFDLKRIL